MINAKLDHCKTIEEFYISIRDQQEEAHGNDYCEQHDALMKYAADCVTYAELGTHQGGTLAIVVLLTPLVLELICYLLILTIKRIICKKN